MFFVFFYLLDLQKMDHIYFYLFDISFMRKVCLFFDMIYFDTWCVWYDSILPSGNNINVMSQNLSSCIDYWLELLGFKSNLNYDVPASLTDKIMYFFSFPWLVIFLKLKLKNFIKGDHHNSIKAKWAGATR